MYEFHEYANIFPMCNEGELNAIVADMKQNGFDQSQTIVTYQDKILDGRNRYTAAQKAGVNPTFKSFYGTPEKALEFALRTNLNRRHLDSGQKAFVALEYEKHFAVLAKERQLATLKQGDKAPVTERFPEREKIEARQQAAAAVGTNAHYVSDAKKIQATAQEVANQVKAGNMSLPEAKKVAAMPQPQRAAIIEKVNEGAKPSAAINEARREIQQEKQAAISQSNSQLPTKRYSVIYADPPWRYEHSATMNRDIENHYPTMELQDICNMPVQDISADDCVLFIWATSPKLAEAMQVISAWGFTYKTCAVWDKQHIGMGYYFRQQHELLLVATKGKPGTPETSARKPSVYSEKRVEHSAKPHYFRDLIVEMYPKHSRIELFCRDPASGWAVWGNQSNGR